MDSSRQGGAALVGGSSQGGRQVAAQEVACQGGQLAQRRAAVGSRRQLQ
jgi:hypothetical protein